MSDIAQVPDIKDIHLDMKGFPFWIWKDIHDISIYIQPLSIAVYLFISNLTNHIPSYLQISIDIHRYPTIYPFISMDLSIDIHWLILCNILWYPHWYPKTYPCISKYLSFWYPVIIQRYPTSYPSDIQYPGSILEVIQRYPSIYPAGYSTRIRLVLLAPACNGWITLRKQLCSSIHTSGAKLETGPGSLATEHLYTTVTPS